MTANPSRLDRLRAVAARWIATLTGDARTTTQARVDQDIAVYLADLAASVQQASDYQQAATLLVRDKWRALSQRVRTANPAAWERPFACAWEANVGRWEAEMANPLRPVPRQVRPYDQEGDR